MTPDIDNKNQFFEIFRVLGRRIIEVFTRRNFGHRYHGIRVLLFIEFILAVLPELSYRFWPGYELRKTSYGFWEVYWSWYAFMGVFFAVSCYHIIIGRKNKNANEAQLKTSYWWGDPYPIFFKLTFSKVPNLKVIAIFIEPFLFFVLGKILLRYDQKLGWLFIICSITFSIDSYLRFRLFKDYIEDQKDNRTLGKIVSQQLHQPLMQQESSGKTSAAIVHENPELQNHKPEPIKKGPENGRVL